VNTRPVPGLACSQHVGPAADTRSWDERVHGRVPDSTFYGREQLMSAGDVVAACRNLR
jgi:hypothetical protein